MGNVLSCPDRKVIVKIDYQFCLSSYLVFRYVAKPEYSWTGEVLPSFPDAMAQKGIRVSNSDEVLEQLQHTVKENVDYKTTAVLLSAGMDSAIIAGLMPQGTKAYTIRFEADDAIDEAPAARIVADALGLDHRVVTVTWDDYVKNIDLLMKHKKAPLHPAEVGLFVAAQVAKNDGIKVLAVGNGADSTFGGMDKLLLKDWTFDDFVTRYTFLDPKKVLQFPVSMNDIFEPYRLDNGFDVMGFLKIVHGLGIIQMFENAIHAAGCSLIAPFEELSLAVPIDFDRIRRGEPKYILKEVFEQVCPGFEIPSKIPFARPVNQWFAGWLGPSRSEFLTDIDINQFSGEQKWQMYCLERFLNLLDSGAI